VVAKGPSFCAHVRAVTGVRLCSIVGHDISDWCAREDARWHETWGLWSVPCGMVAFDDGDGLLNNHPARRINFCRALVSSAVFVSRKEQAKVEFVTA
jgi:hypothetical protein